MADIRKEFGKRLRLLRVSAGMTQQQLAARAKMDHKYLGSLERGERNPTLFNIGRVAEALGATPAELLSIDIPKAPTQVAVDMAALSNLIKDKDEATRRRVIQLIKTALKLAKGS